MGEITVRDGYDVEIAISEDAQRCQKSSVYLELLRWFEEYENAQEVSAIMSGDVWQFSLKNHAAERVIIMVNVVERTWTFTLSENYFCWVMTVGFVARIADLVNLYSITSLELRRPVVV
jgi:hypothetical protein